MLASLNIMINYSQLILYLPSIQKPGHLWTDPEFNQGFAWSPGIVSFGVPEDAFVCDVEIDVKGAFTLSPDAISCIQVPFDINESPLQVGSVFFYDPVDVPKAKYSLFYEVLPGARRIWEMEVDGTQQSGNVDYILKLWFVPDESNHYEIIKMGGAVRSDKVLERVSPINV